MNKYGSPLFLYSEKQIKENINELISICKDFHISYALKANSNKSLLNIIRSCKVTSVDVVSPGEIYKALQNGYKP